MNTSCEDSFAKNSKFMQEKHMICKKEYCT